MSAQPVSKERLRVLFVHAVQRKSALDSFMNLLTSRKALTPYEECYLGICHALEIQYTSGLWAKYKMLDKSKEHIEKAVAQRPQDPELRFVRFMLEHNIPAFMGMSGHMRDDLRLILSHADFLNEDVNMKKMAMEFLLSSKRCSHEQESQVSKILSGMKKGDMAQR